MSADVTIIGPISSTQDAAFHVHATGCTDIKRRREYRGIRPHDWTADVDTFRELVEEIYSDFIFSNDQEPWENFINEVRVFPCVGNLP